MYPLVLSFVDITTALATLKQEHKDDECVKHALSIRSSWALCNFHRFFKLYKKAPKMSGYLIDWFIQRERKAALKVFIKSYVYVFYGLSLILI